MFITLGLTLVLTAAAFVAGADVDERRPKQAILWAAISTPEPVVEPSENFQINFGLVNDGNFTIDPRLESSRLFINGVELKEWYFIVGNGPRDATFVALPPGRSLRFGCALGKFFQRPGIYTVRWESNNFRARDLTFRVIPRVH